MPPIVTKQKRGRFVAVDGTFFRAVANVRLDRVLNGSVSAGRYSAADQPTLYVSASREGVVAAMGAHGGHDLTSTTVATIAVEALDILDLRDHAACEALGLRMSDAMSDWKDIVRGGGKPKPWSVREQAEVAGARGLIDPSRTAPGLWHLVLFAWNRPGAANVRVLP